MSADTGQVGQGGLNSSLSLSGVAMPDDLEAAVNKPQPAVKPPQLHRMSSGRTSASLLPGATAPSPERKMSIAERSIALVYGDTISKDNQEKMAYFLAGAYTRSR